MTETAQREGKSVRTVRMHDGTWEIMESRRGMSASTLINDMTEAGLGFIRCWRCFEPVPVEFGDLTGRPLAEWVASAGQAVKTQHRHGHEPVTIGIRRTGDAASDLAALHAELDQARAALEPLEVRAVRAEAMAARSAAETEALARRLKTAMARERARKAAEAEKRRVARIRAEEARHRRDRQIIDAARAGQDHGSIAGRFSVTKRQVSRIIRDASADDAPPDVTEAARS